MPSAVAGCVTVAMAALPILLAGCGSGGEQPSSNSTGSGSPASSSFNTLKVFQWSPHWECFVSPNEQTCGSSAFGALSSILPDNAIDFANVIEINEESDVYQPPYPWVVMTARCGSPVRDSTALIYNSASWAPYGTGTMGCMDYNDRPFVVQTFARLTTGEKVIVAGAHFPHGTDNGALRNAITQASNAYPDALGVVFAADVNREGDMSTSSILQSIVESKAMITSIAAAQLYPTCCLNDGFVHDYDRIGLTFASSVTTELLFNPAPSWAHIQMPWGSSGEFHKALIATFQVLRRGETEARMALA